MRGPVRLLALPSLGFGSFVLEGLAAARGASRWTEVPPLEPSLRVIFEAVLDRSFGLGLNLLTGVPHPSTLRRAHAEATEMAQWVESEGYREDPRAYHRDPEAPAEVVLEAGRTRLGRHALGYQQLAFASGYRPHDGEPGGRRWLQHPNNANVHAQLLEHPGRPRPWVVCVHGFAMGEARTNFLSFRARQLHEEYGWNVVMPSLPLHGERKGGRLSGGEIVSADYLQLAHLLAQAAWDVRRTIAWVRSRGGSQIALWGVSLGAHVAALVSSLEDDLSAVIAGIPAVDYPNALRDNEPWIFQRYDGEAQVDWRAVRGATHMVSPLAMKTRVLPEGRFIFAGTADRMAPPDQARALWRHWDRCCIHWFSGGHVAGQWNSSVASFVDEALHSRFKD